MTTRYWTRTYVLNTCSRPSIQVICAQSMHGTVPPGAPCGNRKLELDPSSGGVGDNYIGLVAKQNVNKLNGLAHRPRRARLPAWHTAWSAVLDGDEQPCDTIRA